MGERLIPVGIKFTRAMLQQLREEAKASNTSIGEIVRRALSGSHNGTAGGEEAAGGRERKGG